MMSNPEPTFFASCPKGVEDLLEGELRALGAAETRPTQAGVHFRGPLETAYRACLWSRTASRVFLQLAEFPAPGPKELYAGCAAVPWARHLADTGTLAVDCSLSRSAILHSRYAAQVVKDAIVDQLRRLTGRRPSVDLANPDVRLHLGLHEDRALLSLDLSGESLHRRAWRQRAGEAPLKENTAAALLLRAGWPEIAAAGGALADPMCGAGTLPIEAAMIAADIAPGLLRPRFGFQGWKGHDPELWQRLRGEAEARRRAGLGRLPLLFGWDVDRAAVDAARGNLVRAKLEGYVLFERRELAEAVVPGAAGLPPGLVAVNPPYGERMGEEEALRPLYRRLGEHLLAHYPGWRAAVLTASEELAFATGLRATKVHTLYNGAIRCRLARFEIRPERVLRGRQPGSADTAPQTGARAPQTVPRSSATPSAVVGTAPGAVPTAESPAVSARHGTAPAAEPPSAAVPSAVQGAQMLANRLQKKLRLLRSWVRREGIRCYRVYDADLPDYVAAIDLFEERWVTVQEYEPPPIIDPEKARRRLEEILEVVPGVLGVKPGDVFLKHRHRQRGEKRYARLSDEAQEHPVQEAGYRFLVNFSDYLDTGLFLDHRPTRRLIGERARGRRFLNLFAYTATATVYAAGGGAAATTSVDLSNTYLAWAARNLALNGFEGEAHRLVRADCLKWLKRERGLYGLIFLDPPTFSNSKGSPGTFEVQRDHVGLIRLAVERLEPGGELLFSNNYRRFRMDLGALADLEVRDITARTIPKDFERTPRVHNCWLIRRRDDPPAPPG